VVQQILELTGADRSLIKFVPDRPGHDRRYAMNHEKLSADLGWRPRRVFADGLRETVDWYRGNQAWVQSVRSGEYLSYYERRMRRGSRTAGPV
jgi:dTDP-glucose 4,6-dehydratase